ncbi:MAG: hypothetical protein RL216_1374 [Pseudomonadota bacterium]|jgi:hypothetical protein
MKPHLPRRPAVLRAPLASATLPWGEVFVLFAILAILTLA